uniref:PPM-type phosphatase domain-containing protein n=1 Tax=Globodera pallida TaxID=36090 RepID=A0A183CGC0_GLOPA
MIWRRSETSSSSEQNGKSLGRRLEGMGQLSSSELFAVAKVGAVPSTDLETKPEIGSEAARLEKMVIKPSQPIDICRGPSQPKSATHFHHLQRPAQRLLQRSASEMAPAGQCPSVANLALTSLQQKQQHQPRVIQPRRLATNGTTTTAMGSISAGGTAVYAHQDSLTKSIARRYDPHNHQNMHKRSRGFTVGIPLNNQSEGSSEEPNKENSDGERISCGSKSSRTSRKRLNSLELGTMDYDALEGTSAEAATAVEKRQQNGGTETEEDVVVVSEKAVIGGGQQNNDGIGGGGTTPPGTDNSGNGTARRRAEGGRIAYLYGVYGACGDASATAFGAGDRPLRQHRRPAFTDQANILGYDGVCWDDCCCFVEDDEELEEDTDELLTTHGCVVHSLHTVGDIIGYVVRAQRNETLGRLNDVMSQFDALIRSYSLAMKHGTNMRQFAVAGGHSLGGNGGDSANGTPPNQTQLEPAA